MKHSDMTLSPLDGRYVDDTSALLKYFSNSAYYKYRTMVEIEWFIFLMDMQGYSNPEAAKRLREAYQHWGPGDINLISSFESTTRHDTKAIEYMVRTLVKQTKWATNVEMVHFGLTSEDVDSVAYGMMVQKSLWEVMLPTLRDVICLLLGLALDTRSNVMLSRTHGQIASPTTMGKEISVFTERLSKYHKRLSDHVVEVKFGGAVGNMSAMRVAMPDVDWMKECTHFVHTLGLERDLITTQVGGRDCLANIFNDMRAANNVMTDLCRDMWQYCSYGYFTIEHAPGEVGSSTMPQKVNPIKFENAEGNLGLANALLSHMADKLAVSRLQRDLSDSTVMRNIGSAFGYTLIALRNTNRGLVSLKPNPGAMMVEAINEYGAVTEAYQTILRIEGRPGAYEAIAPAAKAGIHNVADSISLLRSLGLDQQTFNTLADINPLNYIGYSEEQSGGSYKSTYKRLMGSF